MRKGFWQLTYAGAEAKVIVRTPRVAELGKYMPTREESVLKHQVHAPIAGLVTAIAVREGETVRAGQRLFTIEAMKMENILMQIVMRW